MMYRGGFYRGGPVLWSAISGIEQALWDIKGRALGVPVCELLGGRARDRMRVYCWIGGDRPADIARRGEQARAPGFTAVKMNATAELHFLDSERARRGGGGAAGGGARRRARRGGRLPRPRAPRDGQAAGEGARAVRPLFIEEPVLPGAPEALREIARHTSAPIACGERLYTRWGFKDVLASGVVDIIQPDLSHAGGILECRKIAAMAEAFDVAVAPHCPLGPIALAASLQLDACTPNALIQEQSLGSTTTRAPTCSTTCATAACSRSGTATSTSPPAPAWAWRSTRSGCAPRPRPRAVAQPGVAQPRRDGG